MAVHHPLTSLATLVVFACVVGALPIGWYGGSYYPFTHPLVPYLGRFSYVSHQPFITLNQGNPFQRYFNIFPTYRPNDEVPDIPLPLVAGDKNKNWILTIMKWPGWQSVITDEGTMKKWEKLISNMGNFTDINNPEWSKQLRQWFEKQPDIRDLFTKVSGFMDKSSKWEKNIEMWLNFISAPTEYINHFKKWLKDLVNNRKQNPRNPFPGGMQPQFPNFRPPPVVPWQRPVAPWQRPQDQTPNYEFDPQDSGFIYPEMFNFNQPRPTEPMDRFPEVPRFPRFPRFPQFPQPPSPQPQPPPPPPPPRPPQQPPFYPQQPCFGYNCLNPPTPDLPQFPGAPPPFPPPPQFPMMNNPYLEDMGFKENPFYGEGQNYELPNMNKLRSENKQKA